MGHFVILIGGPGTFESCDPEHDKIWLNYFYPIQIAAQKDLYQRDSDQVHWLVYEPAYTVRWLEDSEITLLEGLREVVSGRQLHKVRKKAADDVLLSGARTYVDSIQKLAVSLGITYKGISTPQGFWDYLSSLGAGSIQRVWYCGHATQQGLILQLTHNSACDATWEDSSTVLTGDIAGNARIKDRFARGTKKASRFYGCNTADFAQSWSDTFGVPTEGAASSITFAGIFNHPERVLQRLETTPTTKGSPRWSKFGVNGRP
jgi:hypothetical protein